MEVPVNKALSKAFHNATTLIMIDRGSSIMLEEVKVGDDKSGDSNKNKRKSNSSDGSTGPLFPRGGNPTILSDVDNGELIPALANAQAEAAAELQYVLPLHLWVALFGSSCVGTVLATKETSLTNPEVLRQLLIPSFVGAFSFAATIHIESRVHQKLTLSIIAKDDKLGVSANVNGDVNDDEENYMQDRLLAGDHNAIGANTKDLKEMLQTLAKVVDYKKDAYRAAVIVVVGGILFAALGLTGVAAGKLASLAKNKTSSEVIEYAANTVFHTAGGAAFPLLLGKCGIELPKNLTIINAVALAAAVLGEAIVEFGVSRLTRNPIVANFVIAAVVAVAAAATIKTLKCIPGASVDRGMSFSEAVVHTSTDYGRPGSVNTYTGPNLQSAVPKGGSKVKLQENPL